MTLRNLISPVFATALVACGGVYRFTDQPVVWRFADDKHIAEPEEQEYQQVPYFADALVFRRLTRAMELHSDSPAQNTNALDEVPNSSWFTNRIGVRQMTAEEVATAASARGPAKPPLFATKSKTHGNNPGVWVKDARGRKYLVKFDRPGHLGLQTGAGVVVNRLFWAAGYNVPNDGILHFRRDEISVASDAEIEDELGHKRKMTEDDLDALVDRVAHTPDGRLRAMSSEFLEGVPKGGFAPEGVREDDPNDRIPHEHRRELRGLRVLSAWVNYTDVKTDNTLDMYVDKNGRKYLKHYLLDFGESLGGHRAEWNRREHGHEHIWDWEEQGKALLGLGFYVRRWEHLQPTPWPSIGTFNAVELDPPRWRETYPFWPFFEMTADDAYWAAKLVMRFDRAMIAAVVAEAELPEPAAAAYLVDTLVERARRIGRSYLDGVTPLDHFRVRDGRLCAVDLAVRYRLARRGVIERLDDDGDVIARHRGNERGLVCLPVHGSGYTVYRLRASRGGEARPPMQVHARGARILGIVRTE